MSCVSTRQMSWSPRISVAGIAIESRGCVEGESVSTRRHGFRFRDFLDNRNHAHDFVFPGWGQVKRPQNSRIVDCCSGGMGGDPYPETEYVHSCRIEDCEPMGMASLHCLDCVQTSLRRNKFGWRKTKPSQKHGLRPNVCVMVRLTQAFRS